MNTTQKLESPAGESLPVRLGKRLLRTSSAPFADSVRMPLRLRGNSEINTIKEQA